MSLLEFPMNFFSFPLCSLGYQIPSSNFKIHSLRDFTDCNESCVSLPFSDPVYTKGNPNFQKGRIPKIFFFFLREEEKKKNVNVNHRIVPILV